MTWQSVGIRSASVPSRSGRRAALGAVAEGASAAKYNAQFEFNHILEDQQRAAAVAWALAFHRHRLGEEGVVVPPRPDFLRDLSPATAEAEAEAADDDSDRVPY